MCARVETQNERSSIVLLPRIRSARSNASGRIISFYARIYVSLTLTLTLHSSTPTIHPFSQARYNQAVEPSSVTQTKETAETHLHELSAAPVHSSRTHDPLSELTDRTKSWHRPTATLISLTLFLFYNTSPHVRRTDNHLETSNYTPSACIL